MNQKVVLIHGAFLSALSWENYVAYFSERGFDVMAPEWPRKRGDVDQLREHGDELAGLGVGEIVDHYEQIIRGLDTPPVLIGHSFGGLFVQLLLDRGLGRAGVALDPASPKGVLRIAPSSLKVAGPVLNHLSKWHGVVTLTEEQFNYGFTNAFEPGAAHAAFERYAVPETGQIFVEAGFANFRLHSPLEVNFKNDDRAPRLFVAADEDHTIPPATVESNFKKFQHSASRTEMLDVFPGRSHLHMAQDGWDEVAAAIAGWLTDVEASADAGTRS